MTSLPINDLTGTAVLDRLAMACIAGGMDVRINESSSTVEPVLKRNGCRITEAEEVQLFRFDAQGKVQRFRHRCDTHRLWLAHYTGTGGTATESMLSPAPFQRFTRLISGDNDRGDCVGRAARSDSHRSRSHAVRTAQRPAVSSRTQANS